MPGGAVRYKQMRHRTCWVIPALLLAACGNTAGPAASPSPSPKPAGAVVGLVQVENSDQSDPHYGLQKAGVVYEYLAEGGITRFTVVYFNPATVDRVGPVRSIRPTALRLREAYGGVLFFSGGSAPLMAQVHTQHIPENSEDDNGDAHFQRDTARLAPHNLFTTGKDIAAVLPGVKGTSPYVVAAPGTLPASGKPAPGISFQQTPVHRVTYTYSEAARAYAYSSERGPLVDAGNNGQAVQATNVVLLEAPHKDFGYADVNGIPVIDFDLSAGGPAVLLSGGKRYDVKWDPAAAGHPPALKSADGRALALPDGLTWVHIIDPGTY
jgi:hypothetical protein